MSPSGSDQTGQSSMHMDTEIGLNFGANQQLARIPDRADIADTE